MVLIIKHNLKETFYTRDQVMSYQRICSTASVRHTNIFEKRFEYGSYPHKSRLADSGVPDKWRLLLTNGYWLEAGNGRPREDVKTFPKILQIPLKFSKGINYTLLILLYTHAVQISLSRITNNLLLSTLSSYEIF